MTSLLLLLTGLIGFCIVFGIIIGQMAHEARIMIDFFDVLSEVVMRIVNLIMWYAPFGLMCLIAGKIMSIDDLGKTAMSLGMYMLTVIVGLIFHACVTLSLSFFIITRRNPLKFFHGIFQAWITGLATASRLVCKLF